VMRRRVAMLAMMLGRPFGIRMQPCREVAQLLIDYVEGELSAAERRSIDLHLMACPDCQHCAETYLHTQALTQEIRYEDIPEEFQRRLYSVLLEHLRASH
jgi:anti-sigma factor RsiW